MLTPLLVSDTILVKRSSNSSFVPAMLESRYGKTDPTSSQPVIKVSVHAFRIAGNGGRSIDMTLVKPIRGKISASSETQLSKITLVSLHLLVWCEIGPMWSKRTRGCRWKRHAPKFDAVLEKHVLDSVDPSAGVLRREADVGCVGLH